MRDYFSLGPTPSEEDCAQVGQPDYRRKALTECARFIDLIRTTLGPEPAGAELAIKSFPHDFGTYYEVVVWFERDDAAAIAYAVRCEDDAPRTWEGGRHIMTHKAILVHCGHCGHTWPAEALDQIHDYWSRVEPGAVVPLGQCPDVDCGALCYPTYG